MTVTPLDDEAQIIAETAAVRHQEDRATCPGVGCGPSLPVDVLREAAELGMAAIYCSEDAGGSGLRRLDAVRIFEQLAMADPAVAAFLSIHNMCAWMVDRYGTREQRKAWVPRMASMEAVASYCLTEPSAGFDASAPAPGRCVTARTTCSTGPSSSSPGGHLDVYVVMARTGAEGPRGISAFVVESGSPGLSFGAQEQKMGWNAQPTAQVIMEGVRVPADAMLGGTDGEGAGFGIAMSGLNGGRINIAACSLGGAQAAYQKAPPTSATGMPSAAAFLTSPRSASHWPIWQRLWSRRD